MQQAYGRRRQLMRFASPTSTRAEGIVHAPPTVGAVVRKATAQRPFGEGSGQAKETAELDADPHLDSVGQLGDQPAAPISAMYFESLSRAGLLLMTRRTS